MTGCGTLFILLVTTTNCKIHSGKVCNSFSVHSIFRNSQAVAGKRVIMLLVEFGLDYSSA